MMVQMDDLRSERRGERRFKFGIQFIAERTHVTAIGKCLEEDDPGLLCPDTGDETSKNDQKKG
jgi:hypothetical protein